MQMVSSDQAKPMHWNIPVLLTSSVVAHDPRVALTDSEQRVGYALESIAQWLSLFPRARLVLCDGSNFDFSAVVAQRFPGAAIECIYFENDQEAVARQGRGFGEGEIVRYAITHSQWIRQAGAFAKCTSKLWVRNYGACLNGWNGQFLCKGVFEHVFSPIRSTHLSYIDTRFYIASLPYYQRYFEQAHHQIDIASGKGLEECFLEVLQHEHLSRVLMTIPPVIEGVGGGMGKYYTNSLKRRLKERLRLCLVRSQSNFQTLFSPTL